MAVAANPGDPGHRWLAARYVFRARAPWEAFDEEKSGRPWVYAPLTFLDNPFIDREAYRGVLAQSLALALAGALAGARRTRPP